MSNLLRFSAIVIVLLLAVMLLLAVAGVLSSAQLWHSAEKIVEVAAILVGASVLILLFAKK